ncbi:MAG TPA: DUF2218 domain-containing protein [Fodinibius sp.]|nr:DUF2218 domain-containing protein [Fodinibius sp.]
MFTSTISLSTKDASRFIKRLCKHFSHKVEVEFDESSGHVNFPLGECNMEAADNTLQFDIKAANEEDLEKIQHVISSHSDQFARNESFEWKWL